MRRAPRRWALGGLIVLVSLLAYYFLFRAPSPEEVGQDVIAAIEARDGSWFLRRMSEEERNALGLTAERLSCLLTTLFSQYVSADLRNGPVVLEPNLDMGVVNVRQPYKLPDGREWGLGVNVTTSARRPRLSTNTIRALINQRIGLDFVSLSTEEQSNKRQALALLFERLAPELEKCGLAGMPAEDPVKLEIYIEPWDEYIARLRGERH